MSRELNFSTYEINAMEEPACGFDSSWKLTPWGVGQLLLHGSGEKPSKKYITLIKDGYYWRLCLIELEEEKGDSWCFRVGISVKVKTKLLDRIDLA